MAMRLGHRKTCRQTAVPQKEFLLGRSGILKMHPRNPQKFVSFKSAILEHTLDPTPASHGVPYPTIAVMVSINCKASLMARSASDTVTWCPCS
jgi:hypothetical protein